MPDDEINKMTYENAMRWYHWDPFTHITKEQATVGALRKAAEGHDVSIQALSKHEHGGANFADFAANAKELTRQQGLSWPEGRQCAGADESVIAPAHSAVCRRFSICRSATVSGGMSFELTRGSGADP